MGFYSILLLISTITVAYGGNFLIFPSTLNEVHPYTLSHIAQELARRSHKVTWVELGAKQSSVPLFSNITRHFWKADFRDRLLEDIYVHKNHSTHTELWSPENLIEHEKVTGWVASVRLCDSFLTRSRTKFEDLLKQNFDSVIVDDLYNPCGLLFVALKKSVYVYWSQTSMRTESAWANQSPAPPSYLPVPGTGLTDDLTYSERLYNVASYFKQLYIHQSVIQPRIDAVLKKHYPTVPSSFEIERNASLNLINNPPIFDFARPYMPRVNFVGALHCRKAQKLEAKLQDFAKTNFIVLSTGFTAQWKYAPEDVKKAYLATFRAFSTLNFFWQYDGPAIPNMPKNVKALPWLPLQDLLGHSNCLAHVSHGGLNSVIESVWHGVPVIGLPLTMSGVDNLLRISARDAGLMIQKEDFSAQALILGIKEILENKKYKEEMLIFQDMVTDVPFTELYHAVFWMEFIERNGEIPHARSGADHLNILQYFLLDVILFFISVIALTVSITVYIARGLYQSAKSVLKFASGLKRPVKVTLSKKKN